MGHVRRAGKKCIQYSAMNKTKSNPDRFPNLEPHVQALPSRQKEEKTLRSFTTCLKWQIVARERDGYFPKAHFGRRKPRLSNNGSTTTPSTAPRRIPKIRNNSVARTLDPNQVPSWPTSGDKLQFWSHKVNFKGGSSKTTTTVKLGMRQRYALSCGLIDRRSASFRSRTFFWNISQRSDFRKGVNAL